MSLEAANALLAKVWGEFEQENNRRVAAAAKRDPEKYRNSNVMAGHTGYRYSALKTSCGSYRFCRTVNKNVAGFYLTFIEVWSGKEGYRTSWRGHDTKQDAKAYAHARYADAKRPRAERKWTLPPLKLKGRSKAPVPRKAVRFHAEAKIN